MDLIAISRDIGSAVAAHALQAHGLSRERLLLSASHSHYGPEIRPDKAEFFKIPPEFAAKIEPYGRWLTQALIGLVDRALGSLEPVELFARQTKADFASNRRPVNHGVDHDVPILEARDDAGIVRAVVFSYACHNTSLDPMDGQYSGDWAGFAQSQLEEQHPGTTALFVTGAAADQNPDPRYQVELSRQYGAQLADAVHASLAGDGIAIEDGLAVAYAEAPLPFEPLPSKAQLEANLATDDEPLKTKARYLLRAMDEGRAFPRTYPCPVHVVRLGRQLLLVAIGGEPVIDYAHRIKREFATVAPIVWVAGYCNDMFGYVPTRAVLAEGGYEGGRSVLWSALPMPFAAETEDRVMDAVRRLVDKVKI
jgi:neutral ceramidase